MSNNITLDIINKLKRAKLAEVKKERIGNRRYLQDVIIINGKNFNFQKTHKVVIVGYPKKL